MAGSLEGLNPINLSLGGLKLSPRVDSIAERAYGKLFDLLGQDLRQLGRGRVAPARILNVGGAVPSDQTQRIDNVGIPHIALMEAMLKHPSASAPERYRSYG